MRIFHKFEKSKAGLVGNMISKLWSHVLTGTSLTFQKVLKTVHTLKKWNADPTRSGRADYSFLNGKSRHLNVFANQVRTIWLFFFSVEIEGLGWVWRETYYIWLLFVNDISFFAIVWILSTKRYQVRKLLAFTLPMQSVKSSLVSSLSNWYSPTTESDRESESL